ncbi:MULTISPECIES: hypothetical protein [Azospirillum]|uniref:Uncharacterized protein n=1 Tax=Azospirillum brasilense TaxID=192 RepID=A0ABU4NWI2_AZOBR|nr:MULTISPECIES: hypothetical protein [Azospirillum]MDW7555516.1 hypothetical protein [Azospirillum brasilense]MDW7595076.1 hypothetical protein [Azospirillum brasilense]MDW7630229.1 hypothetical protein [Azospirillum brasilense]MDX5949597.1 hypothetical protein [Azospirillum brasilense]TVZ67539.1 hypothetical protein OH82_00679 [Azospirillum brasilense]
MPKVAQLPAPSGTASSPSLSKRLSDATKTPQTILPDGTAQPSTWTPPETVAPDLQREAAAALPTLADWMRPADEDTVRCWLADLGILVAGTMGVEEARAKLGAYSRLLADDYPRLAFTERTLRAAGRRFNTYFPTFGKVAEFLDELAVELRTKVNRVQALAAPPRQRQREAEDEPVSLEQRQRMGLLFGMLGKALTSGDWNAVDAECQRIEARDKWNAPQPPTKP